MKTSKLISALAIASMLVATVADAGSIGRSGGGGGGRSSVSSGSSSRSSSFSAPAPSRPSPSVAPAPSKPGGIGGNASSMGVRKSEVTQPVAQKVEQGRPQNASTAPSNSGSYSAPPPTYGNANNPNFGGGGGVTNGSMFMSSLGGSLAGNLLGNALFGNHGSHGGGTTVINNGTPSAGGGGSVSNGAVASGPGGSFDSGPGGNFNSQSVKKEYTVWSFIADLFGFVIVIAILVGIVWLFYKGFQMIRKFINKERGVKVSQPFSPTQQFWTIQRAFAEANLASLQGLLGPDLVDEATMDLQPSTLTLRGVSHEIVLNTPSEFSVHYTFTDADIVVNQVWHYEKINSAWQLNGIENV